MNRLRAWFCRERKKIAIWSVITAAVSPALASSISHVVAVEPNTVLVVIGTALFALWRPSRDTWLRSSCSSRRLCESH